MIPQVATYPVDHMRCVSSASSRKFDVQSFMVCVSHCLNDIHCLAITYIKEHKECRMSRDETLIDCVLSNGDGSFTRTSRRKCMLNRQVIYQNPLVWSRVYVTEERFLGTLGLGAGGLLVPRDVIYAHPISVPISELSHFQKS